MYTPLSFESLPCLQPPTTPNKDFPCLLPHTCTGAKGQTDRQPLFKHDYTWILFCFINWHIYLIAETTMECYPVSVCKISCKIHLMSKQNET